MWFGFTVRGTEQKQSDAAFKSHNHNHPKKLHQEFELSEGAVYVYSQLGFPSRIKLSIIHARKR